MKAFGWSIWVGMVGTLAVMASAASSAWKLNRSHAPGNLGNGATVTIWNDETPETTEMTVVRFSSLSCDLRVIAQGPRDMAKDPPELLRRASAIAGCNRGYFEMPNFGVHGMQISNGEVLSEIGKGGLWTGR